MRYVTSAERYYRKKGYEEGFKEGYQEGRLEACEAVARKMLLDNQPRESIKKYSGLTEEEINKIKDSFTSIH